MRYFFKIVDVSIKLKSITHMKIQVTREVECIYSILYYMYLCYTKVHETEIQMTSRAVSIMHST